jgi:putative toxin-antitoxin system antitoxin component (TIGR02293 family)
LLHVSVTAQLYCFRSGYHGWRKIWEMTNPQTDASNLEANRRLAELEALALDVFASEDAARGWLQNPHPMLNKSPIEAAAISSGAQRVREILTAIKYGGAA